MKKLLIIVGIVLAVLIILVIALPLLVNVNQFKPTVETQAGNALGRKVTVGELGLSILSGGVTVDDLAIADDPAFSQAPFLQAKQLTVGVSLLPLIFSKKLEVQSFTVTEPKVTLLRSPSGKWNYSSMGGKTSTAQSGAPSGGASGSAPSNFSVGKLTISNGTIVLGTTGANAKTHTYQNVNLEATDISYTSQFPFKLSAKGPSGSDINVEGKAGPIDANDTSLTPFDAKATLRNVNIASSGFVDPSSGMAGILDFTGDVSSDGHTANSKGTIQASKLQLVPKGHPSGVPVNVEYATAYDLQRQAGNLKTGDVHIGKALARVTGGYEVASETPTVQMKMNGQAMPISDLEAMLPAIGVTLPSGASLQGGSLDLNLSINGPVDKLVIAGPVNLSNGKLAGFSMKSKLGALSSFTGLGGGGGGSDTDIQKLSADLHQDPSGTQANNLILVVPSIGTVTGTANVSASGQLDCKMVAQLAGGNAVGAMTSGLSAFTGAAGRGKGSQSNGIPFRITGTTSNPVFIPDVAGVAGAAAMGAAGAAVGAPGTAAKGASGLMGGVGGLLGNKK